MELEVFTQELYQLWQQISQKTQFSLLGMVFVKKLWLGPLIYLYEYINGTIAKFFIL